MEQMIEWKSDRRIGCTKPEDDKERMAKICVNSKRKLKGV